MSDTVDKTEAPETAPETLPATIVEAELSPFGRDPRLNQISAEDAALLTQEPPKTPEPQEEPDIFYGAVRVLNRDGVPDTQGDVFTPETVIELPNHAVNVHSTFDDPHSHPETVIGWATLSLDKQGVLADLWLFKSGEGLTPAIGGSCLDRNADIMRKVRIDYLVLAPSRNCDHRIAPLGAPPTEDQS
jgi:hypothetical protein